MINPLKYDEDMDATGRGSVVLICPEAGCGQINTHATGAVEIYDSCPTEGRWSFRIPMNCESGHDFELRIEQDKGVTQVGTEEYFAPRAGTTLEYLDAGELV